MTIIFRLAIAALILTHSTFAYSSGPVGPAGCGLGNLAFGTGSQVFASTTNGTFGSQTFGITFGTSNCVDSSASAELNQFIEINQIAFANEAAKGEGETLDSVAHILGCKQSSGLAKAIQASYSDIFYKHDLSSKELTSGLLNILETDSSLQAECTFKA